MLYLPSYGEESDIWTSKVWLRFECTGDALGEDRRHESASASFNLEKHAFRRHIIESLGRDRSDSDLDETECSRSYDAYKIFKKMLEVKKLLKKKIKRRNSDVIVRLTLHLDYHRLRSSQCHISRFRSHFQNLYILRFGFRPQHLHILRCRHHPLHSSQRSCR